MRRQRKSTQTGSRYEALTTINEDVEITPSTTAQQQVSHSNILEVANNERRRMEMEIGWGLVKQSLAELTKQLQNAHDLEQWRLDQQEYMHLYTTMYLMCSDQKVGRLLQLYQRCEEFLREFYAATTVLPVIRQGYKPVELILKELTKRWENHKVLMMLFQYLSQDVNVSSYIRLRGLPSLLEIGITSFRAATMHNASEAVAALINREREGGQINRAAVKNVLSIFEDDESRSLENNFQELLLDETAAYYRRKACAWMEKDRCAKYMVRVEKCMERERDRVRHYLYASMEEPLLSRIEKELLLAPHIKQYLFMQGNADQYWGGCHALLHDGKVVDVARMYRLFDCQGGLDTILHMFKEHLAEYVTSALLRQAASSEFSAEQAQLAFVETLIDLRYKYWTRIVEGCFAGNPLFRELIEEAFTVICNKRIGGGNICTSVAELLATYCDHLLMRSSNPGTGERQMSELENALETVISDILAYVSDKDVFSSFFTRKLARRLLSDNESGNYDLSALERDGRFLTKLRQQYGNQFTASMDGMVRDAISSKQNEASFRDYIAGQRFSAADHAAGSVHHNIDLRVSCLTRVYWPAWKPLDRLALPAEMAQSAQTFNEFYQAHSSYRKLTWIHSMGTCTIVGKFRAKDIELIVTTLQAAVLLQFISEDSRLSYSEIKSALNLTSNDEDDDTLTRLLHSLCCTKYKILTKHPPNNTVKQHDCFELNAEFSDKKRRIKLPPPAPAKDEKKKVMHDIETERRHLTEACLVRIMKSRKVLEYQQLLAECAQQLQLRFKPDIKLIKRSIENLVHREFLERDGQNPNVFNYVV